MSPVSWLLEDLRDTEERPVPIWSIGECRFGVWRRYDNVLSPDIAELDGVRGFRNIGQVERLDPLRTLEDRAQLAAKELDLVFREFETGKASYMLDFFAGDGHKKRV